MNNQRLDAAANDDFYQSGNVTNRARLGGMLNYYYRHSA